MSSIIDIAVMKETGLIVISAKRGDSSSLFQFTLQEGRLTGKEIKTPCDHDSPAHIVCTNSRKGIPRFVLLSLYEHQINGPQQSEN